MIKLFGYLKGLVIIKWALQAIKSLWPLILIFLFWPEIDNMMGRFSWWQTTVSGLSEYVKNAANTVRGLPVIRNIVDFLSQSWQFIRARILEII